MLAPPLPEELIERFKKYVRNKKRNDSASRPDQLPKLDPTPRKRPRSVSPPSVSAFQTAQLPTLSPVQDRLIDQLARHAATERTPFYHLVYVLGHAFLIYHAVEAKFADFGDFLGKDGNSRL